MNIPLEVLNAADEAGRGRVVDVFAAEVIAVWARKEALREAAHAALSTPLTLDDIGHEAEEIADAIRALAEGVSDGQQTVEACRACGRKHSGGPTPGVCDE